MNHEWGFPTMFATPVIHTTI